MLPVSALLLSVLWSILNTPVFGQAITVRFENQAFCPSLTQRSALRRLTGVTTTPACSVECAVQANCSAVHRVHSDCYLAARADWQDTWSATESSCRDNTTTLVRLPSAGAGLSDGQIVWLDLRVSLGNLANSSAPAVTLTGAAIRNSSGAQLPGHGDSYVKVPSPDAYGLDRRQGPQGQFGMFVKAEWQPRTSNTTYIYRAASASTVTSWLYEESRTLKFGHRKAFRYGYRTTTVIPSTRSVNTIGLTFNGTQYNIMVNGATVPISIYSSLLATDVLGTDIRLGAKHSETIDGALDGRVICFAYWARMISADEFLEFDKLC